MGESFWGWRSSIHSEQRRADPFRIPVEAGGEAMGAGEPSLSRIATEGAYEAIRLKPDFADALRNRDSARRAKGDPEGSAAGSSI